MCVLLAAAHTATLAAHGSVRSTLEERRWPSEPPPRQGSPGRVTNAVPALDGERRLAYLLPRRPLEPSGSGGFRFHARECGRIGPCLSRESTNRVHPRGRASRPSSSRRRTASRAVIFGAGP